jgi:hypothetical protein
LTCVFVSMLSPRDVTRGRVGHRLITPLRHEGIGSLGGLPPNTFQ